MLSYGFIKNFCKIHYMKQNSLKAHNFIFLVYLVLILNSKTTKSQQTLLVKETDISKCFTIYVSDIKCPSQCKMDSLKNDAQSQTSREMPHFYDVKVLPTRFHLKGQTTVFYYRDL